MKDLKETICAVITHRPMNRPNTRFLLLKSSKNKRWDFVKGQIKVNCKTGLKENDYETLYRELKEETCIPVEKCNRPTFIGEYRTEIIIQNQERIRKTKRFYHISVDTKEVKLSDEHTNSEWLTYKKTKEKLVYQESKQILKAGRGLGLYS